MMSRWLPTSSAPPDGRRRRASLRRAGAPMMAVLVAAMLAVFALTFQAYRAEQDQHATADRALREYAGFAAWEFASNAKEQMWIAMTELLRPIEQLSPLAASDSLPHPLLLARSYQRVKACGCAYAIPALYYFRLDFHHRVTPVTIDGSRHPTADEERWLIDTVSQHAQDLFDKSWRVATIVGSVGGERRTVAYTVVRDSGGHPAAAYGVVAESNSFMAAFGKALASRSLLPPSLTGESRAGPLVSVLVRDEQGHVVYQSPGGFSSGYSAEYPLPDFASGFTVRASLRAEAARRLVLGGFSHRFPVLMALLAITAALVGVGVRQLQREATLTRMRAHFVSSVSHELRTPLAQIRMFAELLRLGWTRSESERTRSLEIIEQESLRLAHLVDKVLCFERADRGATRLVAEPTPLAGLVREVTEAFSPLARARRVSLRLALDENAVALADRGALSQVLINLLDNAVKYGPAGQTITVSAEERGPIARLSVDDQGPGIPVAERQTVWEPFHRLARDSHSAITGSGIGLSVVRALIARHGGRTWVEEGVDSGARFVVELSRVGSHPDLDEPDDVGDIDSAAVASSAR